MKRLLADVALGIVLAAFVALMVVTLVAYASQPTIPAP